MNFNLCERGHCQLLANESTEQEVVFFHVLFLACASVCECWLFFFLGKTCTRTRSWRHFLCRANVPQTGCVGWVCLPEVCKSWRFILISVPISWSSIQMVSGCVYRPFFMHAGPMGSNFLLEEITCPGLESNLQVCVVSIVSHNCFSISGSGMRKAVDMFSMGIHISRWKTGMRFCRTNMSVSIVLFWNSMVK